MRTTPSLIAGALALCMAATSTVAARELTFGMQDAETHNVYKGVVAFKEKLEELSGGEMTVTIFPSSQLGDFKAMVAQVQTGELDMAMTGYPDMSYVCLLYTSPSPRDGLLSRMPSSA